MTSPAASVALDKQRNPGRYCPALRCLWRTGDGTHCPRHAPIAPDGIDASMTRADGYGHAASIAAKLRRRDS